MKCFCICRIEMSVMMLIRSILYLILRLIFKILLDYNLFLNNKMALVSHTVKLPVNKFLQLVKLTEALFI